MSLTTVFSQLKTGTQVAELPGAFDVVYGERLNQPGFASLKLPYTMLPDSNGALVVPLKEALEDGVHEIGIRRGGTVVWLGPLREIVEEIGERGSGSIDLTAEGLGGYLWQWHITGILPNTNAAGHFVNVDQATIAKSFIDHHQAKGGGATFGIVTTGVGTTGKLRDRREYDAYRGLVVGDVLRDLSQVIDGFDWSITPATRAFNVHYPRRGQRREDVTLNRSNIISLRRSRNATDQASAVLVYGDGYGEMSPRITRTDSSAVSKYGLTETKLSLSNTHTPSVLQEHGDTRLAQVKNSPNVFAATVRLGLNLPYGSFSVGDSLRIVYEHSPWEHIDEFRRVVGIDITPFPSEVATVYLSPDID